MLEDLDNDFASRKGRYTADHAELRSRIAALEHRLHESSKTLSCFTEMSTAMDEQMLLRSAFLEWARRRIFLPRPVTHAAFKLLHLPGAVPVCKCFLAWRAAWAKAKHSWRDPPRSLGLIATARIGPHLLSLKTVILGWRMAVTVLQPQPPGLGSLVPVAPSADRLALGVALRWLDMGQRWLARQKIAHALRRRYAVDLLRIVCVHWYRDAQEQALIRRTKIADITRQYRQRRVFQYFFAWSRVVSVLRTEALGEKRLEATQAVIERQRRTWAVRIEELERALAEADLQRGQDPRKLAALAERNQPGSGTRAFFQLPTRDGALH